ncbi:hypothetical protein DAI22_03g101001 [Oryza sativa Japonica Group]|nr:hypothetical protein DAI22_03g101001 [Oryza sativa Japonica Group]
MELVLCVYKTTPVNTTDSGKESTNADRELSVEFVPTLSSHRVAHRPPLVPLPIFFAFSPSPPSAPPSHPHLLLPPPIHPSSFPSTSHPLTPTPAVRQPMAAANLAHAPPPPVPNLARAVGAPPEKRIEVVWERENTLLSFGRAAAHAAVAFVKFNVQRFTGWRQNAAQRQGSRDVVVARQRAASSGGRRLF